MPAAAWTGPPSGRPGLTGKRHRQLPDGVRQNTRGGLPVPRAGVAHFMLKVPGLPETVGQAIGIAS